MSNNTNIIFDILISKFISGNANPEEITQLETWKAQSKDNQHIYNQSLKAWEGSKVWLSDNSVIEDNEKIRDEINRQLYSRVQKIKRQSYIYKIAAVMAIPLAFALCWYFFNNLNNQQQLPEYCQVSAPKGHISKCILPDGSEVWINTNSKITYNISDFNKKNREVKLEGEAFFLVSKNKDKPFKVSTPLADINVTGTSFNVNASPGANEIETVLEQGRIELSLLKNGQTIFLKPGECANYNVDKNKIQIKKVNVEMFSCWRNGEIIFKDATLNDLTNELERIYDIKFHLKDKKLGEYRFRGMFSYSNNLIDALEKIKKTAEIDYYIENKEVWLFQNKK